MDLEDNEYDVSDSESHIDAVKKSDYYGPFDIHENSENKLLKFSIILNFRKVCRFNFTIQFYYLIHN